MCMTIVLQSTYIVIAKDSSIVHVIFDLTGKRRDVLDHNWLDRYVFVPVQKFPSSKMGMLIT